MINSLREKYGVLVYYNGHYGRAVISGKKGAKENVKKRARDLVNHHKS